MSFYLETVNVERYGGLANFEVGPFDRGLNVVYGPNEAGKTTLASFVRGVLFGWEEAHGVRNTYRPKEGDRSGELIWREKRLGSGSAVENTTVEVTRRETGAAGSLDILNDIDLETFDALFSFNSDELRSLRGSPDVVARLLTAGTGTRLDPASAFVEVECRIANTPVYGLSDELELKRNQLREASERELLYVQEDRELRELTANRVTTMEQIAELESELDGLTAARAELAAADKRAERLAREVEHMRDELSELDATPSGAASLDRKLLEMDSSGDRVLRDQLDELAEEQKKIERLIDVEKENSATSTAAYEALCELDEDEVSASRRLRNRPGQAAVAVLLPLAFILAGIPLFVHGRQINSLSITTLGVSLVIVAVFLAAAAFVALFRQPKGSEVLESRRQDAQWVMLQDKKKLDATLGERDALTRRIESLLQDKGLAQAGGSIRQALVLLDEAREARTLEVESTQKVSSLELRIRLAEKELSEIDALRERMAVSAGLSSLAKDGLREPGVVGHRPLVAALDSLIRDKTRQRDMLIDVVNDMSERFGELSHELDQARMSRATDQIKQEYQQIRTKLREAKQELIQLLLARRILERSIATWETQGQPEVYAMAGSLLRVITDGSWVGVSTSRTGSLVALNEAGEECDPRHLSLGTCQQLYLALRIALLIKMEDVGQSLPVLADDILVNFDGKRRQGAALAIAELARHRQVIVFTCHRETVSALRMADPSLTHLNL